MNALEHLPSKADFDQIPAVVGLEQVDAYTQAGWQFRPTSILATYKEGWTEWFAIREFVQNALDETGSFDLVYEDEDHVSYIVDQGAGIDIMDMFLGQQKGATDEEVHCLRGIFGEGMKLALIPLLNSNKKVIIRTVGVDYHFCYVEEKSKRKGVFKYIGVFTKANSIDQGTAIAIDEIDCRPYAKYFAPMIAAADPDKVVLTVKGGVGEYDHCKVRQVFDIPGMIFVRDIYVETTNALFGYNFWFNDTKTALGSDRDQLRAPYAARPEFYYLLEGSDESGYIEELIRRLLIPVHKGPEGTFKSSESLEWTCLDGMRNSAIGMRAVSNLFAAIFQAVGKEFSWSENIAEQKALEHSGIEDLRGILPNLKAPLIKYKLIRDPKDIMKMAELTDETIIFTANDIRMSELEDEIERNSLADYFQSIYDQTVCILRQVLRLDSKLHIYIGEYVDEERVAGFYTVKSDEIYIRAKNLKDFKDYLRVLIHEAAHANCYHRRKNKYSWEQEEMSCSDLSQEFENSLEIVSSALVYEAFKYEDCSIEDLNRDIEQMYRYHDLLDGVIQQKLQEVNNPKGLARPSHINDNDKKKIDAALSRIAKNCVSTPIGLRVILDGFSPQYGSNYDPGRYSRRTGDPLEIARGDQEIVRKIGLDIPPALRNLSKENLKYWIDWINGNYPKEAPYDERHLEAHSVFYYENEDPYDFDACLKLFVNHPDPKVKRRNFHALSRLEGRNVAIEAQEVMQQGLDIYPCLHPDDAWAWTFVKEYLIQSVPDNKIEAIETSWIQILHLGEDMPHPDNRRYTAHAYARQNDLDALLNFLKKENHPNVVDTILSGIEELIGENVRYVAKLKYAKDPEKVIQLQRVILDNYDHLLTVGQNESEGGWTASARGRIKWWLRWAETLDS